MGGGVKIGKIFGINLIVDWSWFLIFLLVAWNLSASFGQLHSDWGTSLRWGVAIGASFLFFASVVAHELAHSLVAIWRGIPVKKITLFLFGGVSNIQREPDSPMSEFLITIVGPLTSIGLGGLIFLIASFFVSDVPQNLSASQEALTNMGPWATLLLWLAPTNILVGVFNLIPGFPLDGGRILRSILWKITDNLKTATRWAMYVGQVVAWGLIFAGIAMVFGVNIPIFGTGLSGLWLAFIGWFLSSAAMQSYRQTVVRDILEDVDVSEVMRRNPPTVQPDCTIEELIQEHVLGTDDHSFPVMQDDRLFGIVTLDDIRDVPRQERNQIKVREIMTKSDELQTVAPGDDVSSALDTIRQQDIRQLPVVQNNQLIGIIRRRDILRWLQLQSEKAA